MVSTMSEMTEEKFISNEELLEKITEEEITLTEIKPEDTMINVMKYSVLGYLIVVDLLIKDSVITVENVTYNKMTGTYEDITEVNNLIFLDNIKEVIESLYKDHICIDFSDRFKRYISKHNII